MSTEPPYCHRMGEVCTGVCPDCPPSTHSPLLIARTDDDSTTPSQPFNLRDVFIIRGGNRGR